MPGFDLPWRQIMLQTALMGFAKGSTHPAGIASRHASYRSLSSFLQAVVWSLRANGSRECAPDDRLREAIHRAAQRKNGLLRRSAPRNDAALVFNVSATVVSSRSRWERWTEDVALDVPCAAERAELELLHGAPRRGVVMSARID